MQQSEQLGNLANAANVIAGTSFLIATWFLRDFVRAVKDFMRDTERRLVRVETQLEIAPEDVGAYHKKPRTIHRREP